MDSQEVMMGSRVLHIRELKAELERQKAANAALREENASLKAHFELSVLAASELKEIPEGGRLEIWDGWNLLLGAKKAASDRDDLVRQARELVEGEGGRAKVWIVFDGHDERVTFPAEGVRVSYTGGTGEHRADRFICSYLRMTMYLGLSGKVTVWTNDKDFKRDVLRLGGKLRQGKAKA